VKAPGWKGRLWSWTANNLPAWFPALPLVTRADLVRTEAEIQKIQRGMEAVGGIMMALINDAVPAACEYARRHKLGVGAVFQVNKDGGRFVVLTTEDRYRVTLASLQALTD
jgi:hypothetical protein